MGKREQAALMLAEADAEDALIAAKAAYRANPTPATKKAKDDAVAAVRELHNANRGPGVVVRTS